MMAYKGYREHVVTDQGNGSAYCSECHFNLTGDFVPSCPNCLTPLIDTTLQPYPYGGSDF